MRSASALVGLAAVAAGTVGAAWAYDSAAPAEDPVPVASPSQPTVKAVAKRPRLVWAPCRPPATLHRGVCVTDVVRTVVLPALPAPTAPPQNPAPSAPVPPARDAGTPTRAGGDDQAEHEDQATHDDHGDDDGDDREDDGEHEDEHDGHEAPEPEEPEGP